MDRLKAMQVFVEVADRGSLSAAAVHLDMSRAMVSRYLAEMEQWVGVRLLHRTTRRLSLTPAGAETLPRCRQMLDMVGDLRSAVSTPEDTPRGLLRMTTSMSFGSRHLARVITDYVKLHPGTSVDLMLVDRTVNLVEERVDLAVRITNDLDPNLIARKLAVCRSIVCALSLIHILIVRGVNMFPTQVEELVLKIAQLAPHYQLVLSRTGNMDELEILTEVRAEFSTLSDAERAALGKQLQHAVKTHIGVSARIQVSDAGHVERTLTGKARRVIDKRPKG